MKYLASETFSRQPLNFNATVYLESGFLRREKVIREQGDQIWLVFSCWAIT
jgi:hypothetical protein